MKQNTIEYTVFHYGEEVGKTMAVSEKQAINNYRYSNIGILGMYEEGDSYGYSAIATVVLKFQNLKLGVNKFCNQKTEYAQERLLL